MKLKIENFQSLQKVELELAPLTVISGASDKGKSSLVRALEACLFNTEGKDFISWGKKLCCVSLGDGVNSIEYSKGTSTTYTVNGHSYSAIGRGPFEEVAKLGYREIDAEHMKVRPQFSKQYDAPFLIADEYSPTAVASILGTLSDSTIVTKAKKALEGDLRELTSKINHVEGDVEKLGATVIDQDSTILELSLIRDKIVESQSNTAKLHEQLIKVVNLGDHLNGLRSEIKELMGADITVRNAISSLDTVVIPRLMQNISRESRVMELAQTFKALCKQIGELDIIQKNLNNLNDLDFTKLEKDVRNHASVENLGVLATNLVKFIDYLHKLVVYISERLKAANPFFDQVAGNIHQLEKVDEARALLYEVEKLEEEQFDLANVLAGIESMRKDFHACPLCEREF